MKERLSGLLTAARADTMTVDTFHGLGLGLLRRHAERAGLKADFAIHGREHGEAILALAPSPWLGVNFDTANPHRGDYVGTTREGYEWKLDEAVRGDELAVLRPVAARVRHVHWKDVTGRDAVILGRGTVRRREELEILLAAGYDGALSYETEGWEDADASKRMIVESLRFTHGLLDGMGIEYE